MRYSPAIPSFIKKKSHSMTYQWNDDVIKTRWKLDTGRAKPAEIAKYKRGLCSAVDSIS